MHLVGLLVYVRSSSCRASGNVCPFAGWLAVVVSCFVSTVNLQENYCKIRIICDEQNLSLWYLHRLEPINSSSSALQFFCVIEDYRLSVLFLAILSAIFLTVIFVYCIATTRYLQPVCITLRYMCVHRITYSRTSTVLIGMWSQAPSSRTSMCTVAELCSNQHVYQHSTTNLARLLGSLVSS